VKVVKRFHVKYKTDENITLHIEEKTPALGSGLHKSNLRLGTES
jgi:hypothetical protein